MVGRKAPKSGRKKLRVANDLKAKTMKKLKLRRKENAVDLGASTKVKVLEVASRGKDKGRLVARISGVERLEGAQNIPETILLLHDGLLQKKLEGLSRVAELLETDPDHMPLYGKLIFAELGLKAVDQERHVRQYAIHLAVDFLKAINSRFAPSLPPDPKPDCDPPTPATISSAKSKSHSPSSPSRDSNTTASGRRVERGLLQVEVANTKGDSEWAELASVCSELLRCHLRTSLTNLQRSISRDGLIYLQQGLLLFPTFARENEQFVLQLLPLVTSHQSLLDRAGSTAKMLNNTDKSSKRSELGWPCVKHLENTLAPVLNSWGALYLHTLLLSFVVICADENDGCDPEFGRSKSWQEFERLLSQPSLGGKLSLKTATPPALKKREQIKMSQAPGSDFLLGRLLLSVDNMLAGCEAATEHGESNLRLLGLCVVLIRWILAIGAGNYLAQQDDLFSDAELAQNTLSKLLFASWCRGSVRHYRIAWLVREMGVISTVRKIIKLINKQNEKARLQTFVLAQAHKMVDSLLSLLGHNPALADLYTRAEEVILPELPPRLAHLPTSSLPLDTLCVLYKAFGPEAVPPTQLARVRARLHAFKMHLGRLSVKALISDVQSGILKALLSPPGAARSDADLEATDASAYSSPLSLDELILRREMGEIRGLRGEELVTEAAEWDKEDKSGSEGRVPDRVGG